MITVTIRLEEKAVALPNGQTARGVALEILSPKGPATDLEIAHAQVAVQGVYAALEQLAKQVSGRMVSGPEALALGASIAPAAPVTGGRN